VFIQQFFFPETTRKFLNCPRFSETIRNFSNEFLNFILKNFKDSFGSFKLTWLLKSRRLAVNRGKSQSITPLGGQSLAADSHPGTEKTLVGLLLYTKIDNPKIFTILFLPL